MLFGNSVIKFVLPEGHMDYELTFDSTPVFIVDNANNFT